MNIAISAKMCSGKGEAAAFIRREYGFKVISFADPLKELAELAALDDVVRNTRVATIVHRLFTDRPHMGPAVMQRYAELTMEFAEELASDAKPRGFLQTLGTAFRELYQDCWASFLVNRAIEEQGNWICDDMRYLNETRYAREAGWTLVRINVDEEVRRSRLTAKELQPGCIDHPSEVDLDSFQDWDVVWNNFGTLDDLNAQIAQSLQYLPKAAPGSMQ